MFKLLSPSLPFSVSPVIRLGLQHACLALVVSGGVGCGEALTQSSNTGSSNSESNGKPAKVIPSISSKNASGVTASSASGERPSPRQLRLLSPSEYKDIVAQLFSIKLDDPLLSGLTSAARKEERGIPHVIQYWDVANQLSKEVDIKQVIDCEQVRKQDCVALLTEGFLRQAYQRPLSDVEVEEFSLVYFSAKTSEQGIRRVLNRMLMSPSFIYRYSSGEIIENSQTISPYKVAGGLLDIF